MKRLAVAVTTLLMLQGCTVIQATQYTVARYCGLPEKARLVTRAAVAKALTPNRVEIACYD